MFQGSQSSSTLSLLFNFLEVTYHSSARAVRKTHNNSILAIVISVAQAMLFIAAFYFMFTVLGTRAAAIRGNFMLYLMSGIFLYLTHIQTVQAVMRAEGATAAMMQHAPMNTLVSILSAAISTLYIKTISILCILLMIHTMFEPIEIHNWRGALLMFLLVWATGVAIGIVFMAAKPWMPDVVNMVSMIYIRANMIFSGKMFVANMMPAFMLPMFTWNPLFHIIDQTRGFVFVNYFPHVTNWVFPLIFTAVAILLGLMLDAYTRKHVSASWEARR